MEDFSKISDILNEAVFDKNSYSASIKKAVAFGFWKDITGKRFKDFSLPYDIKGSTLFVSVKNPQVMQELIFYKNELLGKIRNYFLPVGINIEEIRYDYKNWNKLTQGSKLNGDDFPEEYSADEIEEVTLNKFETEEIKKATNTISELSFLNSELREKCKKNVVNSMKVRKLRMK